MRVVRFLAIVGVVLCGAVASRAQDGDGGGDGGSGSAFVVSNIDVDVAGKSTDEARLAAFREAQRQAWPQLWARMTGNPPAQAPKLNDGALDSMVAGIEVDAERFSLKRYIGRLSVIFDRVRAGKYFGNDVATMSSPPMLLLPVLTDAGASTVYETQSPWLRAWSRYRPGSSPMQYVRATTVVGDSVLLNAYQSRRDDRALWRNILNRFRAADVLTAEAKLDRTYPGGPVIGSFVARHGPDATELTRFRLQIRSSTQLDRMLDQAVSRIDAAYGQALREGRLRSDPTLTADLAPPVNLAPVIAMTAVSASGVELNVATPDATTWSSVESALRSTPTVSGVTLVSLSLGGTSRIRIGHSDSYDWLLYNLDQRGLRIDVGEGGLRLRRKVAGDVVVPRPIVTEEAIDGGETNVTPVPAPAATPRPAGGPTNLLPEQ
ncbi:heavy-metal-associated domain-containing protein [Sphingoaurantiacus capsulatus]|uniref:Heavy-metal-associated domain-containing protein n=1 Tax=Sphingoaurantiacus capsulatus TaxID=1771310 RepID=A0ABV7XC27_9SPHN